MSRSDASIREILYEGLDDWVPIDQVIASARELAVIDGSDFREVSSMLITRLIEEGLMVPGSLESQGFEAWTGLPRELVDRVLADCKKLNWEPFGAGCWLANTDYGDEVAKG